MERTFGIEMKKKKKPDDYSIYLSDKDINIFPKKIVTTGALIYHKRMGVYSLGVAPNYATKIRGFAPYGVWEIKKTKTEIIKDKLGELI